ncbi:hypothetical protein JRO89_XS03G0142000 [Xanthoceras sorbifolium]|uniref:RNA polymerase II subunit B1 CTD phosphatase RPAP2 homolog n=1 Tax=Xanthoceras sorbifolium TaxID=99658 RepID=A0ABQ8IAA3_9ROSI|nr:hypothetical protein JRO89_XS03G0142000 [Xanthoceras sorbifolium]
MEVKAVNDAIHRLQPSLLEGIRNEKQLLAVESLMSQRDYEDTMTERSIVNLCSYQLCSNSLSSSNSWLRKGRYRISLKEHKLVTWIANGNLLSIWDVPLDVAYFAPVAATTTDMVFACCLGKEVAANGGSPSLR